MAEQKDENFDYDTWVAIGQANCWGLEPQVPSRDEINEHLNSIDESVLLMDGFDEALIGFTQRINEPILAVYSYFKMVHLLIHRDGMSIEDAEEFIDFNCIGAWLGERTPIIVTSLP